jgi:calcium-binding protein CML
MQEELKEMVENVDTDGSGSIEFLEFLLLMGKILNDSPNQEDLRNIFTGQVFLTHSQPPRF